MEFADNSGDDQPYKYNGKELDRMHGLNMYDYSARFMEPGVGRFTTVDPLAEKYYSISPYVYCAGNPIKFTDPDGRSFTWPPFDPTYYRQAAASQKADQIIKENHSTIQRNGAIEVASYSDLNDAVVLGTAITRGKNAINIDGTQASGVDIGFAGLGAIIPVVSGSAVKKVLKGIGKSIGIITDTKKVAQTSRAARREVMREAGIPTSQQPVSQSKNASGREYTYEVPKEGGGSQTKSVQQQTKDRSHVGESHWEAGSVKVDDYGNVRFNSYDRPKLNNDKSKVDYIIR